MILLENSNNGNEAIMLENDEEIEVLFNMLEENGIIFTEDGIILEGETANQYYTRKMSEKINNEKNRRKVITNRFVNRVKASKSPTLSDMLSDYYKAYSALPLGQKDDTNRWQVADAIAKHRRREEHKNKNKKSVNEFCDLI